MPLNVCLGWKEHLCSNWWVSVGLKKTFVSNWDAFWGSLKTVVSRKLIESGCISALKRIGGECEFRMFKNSSNFARPCCQTMNMSSRYRKYT